MNEIAILGEIYNYEKRTMISPLIWVSLFSINSLDDE